MNKCYIFKVTATPVCLSSPLICQSSFRQIHNSPLVDRPVSTVHMDIVPADFHRRDVKLPHSAISGLLRLAGRKAEQEQRRQQQREGRCHRAVPPCQVHRVPGTTLLLVLLWTHVFKRTEGGREGRWPSLFRSSACVIALVNSLRTPLWPQRGGNLSWQFVERREPAGGWHKHQQSFVSYDAGNPIRNSATKRRTIQMGCQINKSLNVNELILI